MSRYLSVCLLALVAASHAAALRAQDVPVPFPPPPKIVNPPKDADVRPLPPKDWAAPPKDLVPPPPARPMPPPPPPPKTAPPITSPFPSSDPQPAFTAETFDRYRVFAGADVGLYQFRKAPIAVPLAVTTTSPPGPGANVFGKDPNVRIVLGQDQIDQEPRLGGRAWLGFWFDDARSLGIEVVGSFIQSDNERVTVQSDGSVILSRPIVMPGGINGVYDIGYPDAVRGSFTVQNHQQLQGLELNFLGFALGNHRFAFDLLAGVRYLDLQEQIELSQQVQVTSLMPMPAFGGDFLATGTRVAVVDSFRTTNQFYGGQVGGRFESNFGRLSIAVAGKLALGVNEAILDVAGSTTRSDAAGAYRGGILANAANIGSYRESNFAYVPEASLTAGWWLTPNVRVKVGYNVLYVSDVIRPGSQISNAVNPVTVPVDPIYGTAPVTRTSPRFQRTDFLAEGISFGIDIRY